MDPSEHPKMIELQRLIDEQDERDRKQDAHDATVAELTAAPTLDEGDADRLELLDRIAQRVPGLDLDQYEVTWGKTPDGAEALILDEGRFGYFANAGADLHVVGSTDPLIPGMLGIIAIYPDGTRELIDLIPDPLADDDD